MKTLAEVRREMMYYAKTVVDLEDGETPKDWVDTYIEALKEDGMIVTIKGKKYVKD